MHKQDLMPILKGLATYIPGLRRALGRRHISGEPISARRCYSICLHHLALIDETCGCGVPARIAELGPGDTLGTGLATLISGGAQYTGIDVLPFARNEKTLRLLSELVPLFRDRCAPAPHLWLDCGHLFDEKAFPKVVNTEVLRHNTTDAFVEGLARETGAVLSGGKGQRLRYLVSPAMDDAIVANSLDFAFSHSVLEHVTDLSGLMRTLYAGLKPGGLMSHQYDLSSHNIVAAWDGHRRFNAARWTLVVGNRAFMINRLSHSEIVRTIEEAGFCILRTFVKKRPPTVPRSELGDCWKGQPDSDLEIERALVQAVKPDGTENGHDHIRSTMQNLT